MQTQISIFDEGITNTRPSINTTLAKTHQYIISDEPKEATLNLRGLRNKEEAKLNKAHSFKFATFSGTFTQRSTAGLKIFSGYLCLDIDDVNDLEKVKKELTKDSIFEPILIFTSPSGNGLKVVYRIDKKTNPKDFGLAYDVIADHIEQMHDCKVDRAPKSVASACFLSWDPESYFNPDAGMSNIVKTQPTTPVVPSNSDSQSIPSKHEFEKVLYVIEYLESKGIKLGEEYSKWVQLAMALTTFGEDGRELFHRVSKISPKYDSRACEKLFSDCLQTKKGSVTLGTFFHLVQDLDVKLAEALEGFNTLSIVRKDPQDFWNEETETFHSLACENLKKDPENPIFKEVYKYALVDYETLVKFNVGLMTYSLDGNGFHESLVLRHAYGMQLYWFDGQWQSGDYPGSFSQDSLFGLDLVQNKEDAIIACDPFQAMFLSQTLKKMDCVAIIDRDMVKTQYNQKKLLSVFGSEWKRVIIIRDGEIGKEARNVAKELRTYSDVFSNNQEVYWLNPLINEGYLNPPFHLIFLEEIIKDKVLFEMCEFVPNNHTIYNRIHYFLKAIQLLVTHY